MHSNAGHNTFRLSLSHRRRMSSSPSRKSRGDELASHYGAAVGHRPRVSHGSAPTNDLVRTIQIVLLESAHRVPEEAAVRHCFQVGFIRSDGNESSAFSH